MKRFKPYKENEDYYKVLRMIRSYNFTTSRFPNYRELQRYTSIGSLSKLHRIITTLEYHEKIQRNNQGKIIAIFKPKDKE